MLLNTFTFGRPPTNPQRYLSNDPNSFCTARNALALAIAEATFSRLRMIPSSANNRATNLARFLEAAAQDGGDRFLGNKIGRNSHDIERADRATAHRENVGERVGRGDLAVGEWVVDDRGKKIGRLHEGALAIEPVDPGVIGGGGTDEYVAILILR